MGVTDPRTHARKISSKKDFSMHAIDKKTPHNGNVVLKGKRDQTECTYKSYLVLERKSQFNLRRRKESMEKVYYKSDNIQLKHFAVIPT